MAKTEQAIARMGTAAVEKMRGEITSFVGAQVGHLAEKAGDKLTGITGQLTEIAENDGKLPSIGTLVGLGESPVKTLISSKAKDVKDNVVDKVTGGGGGSGGKAGDTKVTSVIESLDVGVPIRTAYDHWTNYEKFSGFTKGVRSVSADDETTTQWKVKVGPSSRSFEATVLEQIPDDRIVWESEGAKGSTHGVVTFHELAPSLTRIVLVIEYYPAGFFEKTGNLWRVQGRRMRLDFKHFQRYVTLTDEEAEGWRGEIRDGEVVRSHEDAIADEEAEGDEDEEAPDDDAAEDELEDDDEQDDEQDDDEQTGEWEDDDEEDEEKAG
ncbi:SRPBCC family protein [Streptomyces sp. SID3212]|uniref:SRPBCC family protein n=1 Tax=Streptomyces sp. SID3212 TaxID=2690259 RepID=UPI001370DA22|nr:SRPBCC family protein [Streptomyces sp. SID3212]MYV57284.1 polyketide cyclase [Streptomyces sp. SID3212]